MSEIDCSSGYDRLAPETVTLAYSLDAELTAAQAAVSTKEKVIYDERLLEAALERDLAGLSFKKGLSETDFLDCYRAIIDHYSEPKRAEHLDAMLELRQHLSVGDVVLSTRAGEVAVERIAAGADDQPLAQPALIRRSVYSGSYLGRDDKFDYDLAWMLPVEFDDQLRAINLTNRLGIPAVSYYLDHLASAAQMSDTTRADGYDLIGQSLKAKGFRKLAEAKAAFDRARQRLPSRNQ